VKILIKAWRDLAHPLAGGSERLVDTLASGLIERGHDVSLLAGGPVGEHRYRTIDAGGTYTQYVRGPLLERRLGRPDVVVDVANGMTYCTPLWRRRPTVLVVHHVHLDQWVTRFPAPVAALGRAFERHVVPWVYRRSLFVAVSPSTADALSELGVDERRIRIVHNAVDVRPVPTARSREPLFVVLGRLMPYKRVELALRAWPRVRSAVGGRLVVAGDGPDGPRLREMAPEGVEFVGHIPEAEKRGLLARAWLLVQTAMHEGWGVVITEAGALGTPAIGFDVPGVRDAIVDGSTGVLVEDEDELVETWVDLATDPARRRELGERAAEHACQFTPASTVERFVEVLEEAASGGGAR